jgi:aspartyl-tRNA(Asn)/glutamyl-tRNA(Gln) amidotransferase subunit A
MKVRRVLQDKTKAIFAEYDLLLLPTTPTTAFESGAVNDPIQMYLQDIFTVHANLTGNPAISIPVGNHSNGLPFGIQLMADTFNEKQLINFAQHLATTP